MVGGEVGEGLRVVIRLGVVEGVGLVLVLGGIEVGDDWELDLA